MASADPVNAAAALKLINYATNAGESALDRLVRIEKQQQVAINCFISDIEELTKQIDKTNDKYSEAENALMEKVASLEKHEEKEIGSAASARSTHDRESEKLNRQIVSLEKKTASFSRSLRHLEDKKQSLTSQQSSLTATHASTVVQIEALRTAADSAADGASRAPPPPARRDGDQKDDDDDVQLVDKDKDPNHIDNRFSNTDWKLHIKTADAQKVWQAHNWSESCAPLPTIERLIEHLTFRQRHFPISYCSYFSYCHEEMLDPSFALTPAAIHLQQFILDYQQRNHNWHRMNESAHGIDSPVNQRGSEGWMIDGKYTVIGKIFHKALEEQVELMSRGLPGLRAFDSNGRRTVDLLPCPPQHVPTNFACCPTSHLKITQYCAVDEVIAGALLTIVTPESISTVKPSFWHTLNDIYKSVSTDGSKSYRMMKIIIEAQPTAHHTIALTHTDHYQVPYIENTAFHDYLQKILVDYSEFMKQHNIIRPDGGTISWDDWLWNKAVHSIRINFRPERAQLKSEYYRQISDISSALDKAFKSDGTFDQSILDAHSTRVRDHVNPSKGIRGILRMLGEIYTLCTTDGSWVAKTSPAHWSLPIYDEDRYGITARPSEKRLKSHFSALDDDLDDLSDELYYAASDEDFLCHSLNISSTDELTLDRMDDIVSDMADNGFGGDEDLTVLHSHLEEASDEDEAFHIYVSHLVNTHPRMQSDPQRKARIFKLLVPGRPTEDSRQTRLQIRQQQQQGSYYNPKSHTPDRRGGSGDDFRKAGFRGKGFQQRRNGGRSGSLAPRSKFSSNSSSSFKSKWSNRDGHNANSSFQRGDNRFKYKSGEHDLRKEDADMARRRRAFGKRDTMRPQDQTPFVRSAPTPSTVPGRALYDRIRAGNSKLKNLLKLNPKHTKEIKEILQDLDVYHMEPRRNASRGSELRDKLYSLRDDAESLTNEEIEERLYDINNDDDDDSDDERNYHLTDCDGFVSVLSEDGEIIQLHYSKIGPEHFIVDTGGSRDMCQNKNRFLKGSLVKLKKPIAIHMAAGVVYATHVGVLKYTVRAHRDFHLSDAAFSWLSLGLLLPTAEDDLAIMSVPTHKRLGISFRSEGDSDDHHGILPYLYSTGQSVHGIPGATMPSLIENGDEFRGVETTTVSNSNMMLLEVISPDEIDYFKEIDMLTGDKFDMKLALHELLSSHHKVKGFNKSQQLKYCSFKAIELACDEITMSNLSEISNSTSTTTDDSATIGIDISLGDDKETPSSTSTSSTSKVHTPRKQLIFKGNMASDPVSPPSLATGAGKSSITVKRDLVFEDGEQISRNGTPLKDKAEDSTTSTDIDNAADVTDDKNNKPSSSGKTRRWLPAFVARMRTPFRRSVPDKPPSKTPHHFNDKRVTDKSSGQRVPNNRSWSNASSTLKVLLLCSGLASLIFGGWWHLRTEVVGVCESNAAFYPYYKQHCPNATIYEDMRSLSTGLHDGSVPYFHTDIIECTAPCPGRTSLRWHNGRQNDPALDKDLDLFLLTPNIVEVLLPSYVVCEMTPEHADVAPDYDALVAKMKALGYKAHVYDRLGSYESGDATSRFRYFAIFIHWSVPKSSSFDLKPYLPGSGGPMSPLLDKPSEVPAHLWVTDRFVTREGGDLVVTDSNSRVRFSNSPMFRALNTATRSLCSQFSYFVNDKAKYFTHAILLGNIFTTSMLGGKVYSRHGPYITITREARGMIFDDRDPLYSGVRYPSLNELARFSGFVGPQRKFLRSLPTEKEALLIVAGAVTFNTTRCVYSAICDHALQHFERNFFLGTNKLDNFLYNYTDSQSTPSSLSTHDCDSTHCTIGHCLTATTTTNLSSTSVTSGTKPNSSFERVPFDKDLGLSSKSSRAHVPRATFEPLPKANTSEGLQRCRDAWKLHNTICPCSAETFENTIAITSGTSCKPGDSRIVKNCPKCLRFNQDTWGIGQRSKSDTRFHRRFKPGEAICLDGADARTTSKFGHYSIVLIAVDMASMKTYSAYLRGNSSREFIDALDNLRKMIHLETGNKLRSVTSDAFSTYLEHISTADWRDIHSIELLANPGHAKQWNAYAENRIRQVKKMCRSSLDNLKGKEISGAIVTDPTVYWPLAWNHAVQALNMRTHTTLEQWHGFPCSPDQVASNDFSPRSIKLLPFASVGYMLLEKEDRDGPLHPTNERVYYGFNGQYNLLVNKFSNSFRSHIVISADKGSLVCTAKVRWTPDDITEKQALASQHYLPGGNLFTDRESTSTVDSVVQRGTTSPTDDTVFENNSTSFRSSRNSSDATATHASGNATTPTATSASTASTASTASSVGNAASERDPEVSESPSNPQNIDSSSTNTTSDNIDSPTDVSTPLTATSTTATVPPSPRPPPDDTVDYAGRRVRIPLDNGGIIIGTVLTRGVETGTNKTLWHVRRTNGVSSDYYTSELVPMLVPDESDAAPVIDAPITAPDVLPSMSHLYKERDDVKIKCLNPNAKSTKPRGNTSKPSKSSLRFEKYKNATTIGEYKRLGGTSGDFINDMSPTRRIFTFSDPEMERQHLQWLDDGGDVPIYYVHRAVEAAFTTTLNHPAIKEAILHAPINQCQIDSTADKLKAMAYRFAHDPTVYNINHFFDLDDIPLNKVEEKLTATLIYEAAQHRDSTMEVCFVSSDDLVIDQQKLTCLKDIPIENIPGMMEAISKEMKGLIDKNTFSIEVLPPDRETINCKFVLKVKYKANGDFDVNKARCVVQGFNQRMGKDFYSTFSPMASLTSVRMILAMAVHMNLPIKHMDVPQAFIQAMVDADIYVKLPKGVSILTLDAAGRRVPIENTNKALKLLKALYGLKQAPQLWNKELTSDLATQGFERLNAESSIYLKREAENFTVILAEVDDLIVTGTDQSTIDKLRQHFVDKWKIKDWDTINSFLGINVNYDQNAGFLSMDVKAKIDDFFKSHSTGFGKLGITNTPYVETMVKEAYNKANHAYSTMEKYLQDNFASIVGSLIYLSITCRPDIVYSVNQMAKGMHKPQLWHVIMMKQCLKYLNGHRGLSLVYRRTNNLIEGLFRTLAQSDGALQTLHSIVDNLADPTILFADADYANDPETRKSITGKATFLFNCLVSWQSKRQPVIASSTHEAEIIAMSFVADEGIWQRRLLHELGIFNNSTLMTSTGQLPPTPLLSDNKASTFTANTPSTGVRSKHIDVRFLKVREYVANGELRVVHVRTDYNVADFFTKGLTIAKFSNFRNLLMGEQPSKKHGSTKSVTDGRNERDLPSPRLIGGHPNKGKTTVTISPSTSPSPSPPRDPAPSSSSSRKRRSTSKDDPHHCLDNYNTDPNCITDRARSPCPTRLDAFTCLAEVELQRPYEGPRDRGERSEGQCCMWSSISSGIDSEDAVLFRDPQRRRFTGANA